MDRKPSRHSFDQALVGAEVLAEEYADFDERAMLDRIARRVVWGRASAMEQRAQWIRTTSGAADRDALAGGAWPVRRTALHARASSQLEALSSHVVRDRSAIAAMALLVDDRATIEPQGALAFACLLYLADRHEAAQFWWQFAAGADSVTAAHCLYLHHLQHAEPHLASQWHTQATTLYREDRGDWRFDHPPTPVDGDLTDNPHDPAADIQELEDLHALLSALNPEATSQISARWQVFNSPLADAVGRLEVHNDDDFGQIPRPDPDLAAELCAASTSR
nr:hypothetical protein [Streptomyces sp. SAJ15]